MTVIEMVEIELKRCGFDGLYSDECACLLDHLGPCGEIRGDCRPGYQIKGCVSDCSVGGCDFHVGPTKPTPPKPADEKED